MSTTLPTVPFGRTDMSITRVGFGAWAIGGDGWAFGWGPQEDSESVGAIVHTVERGINWVDTAAIYGLGHSEEVTARAMKAIPEADRPYLFTKGGLRWDDNDRMKPARRVGDPASIRDDVEQSLRRLDVDRIDLFQMHWPAEDGNGVEAYWPVFAELMDAGKLRAVGLSNHFVRHLEVCEPIHHVDSLQPPFHMLNRKAAAEEFSWCSAHGTAVIVYSPMASGILTGAWSREKAASLGDGDWRSRTADHAGENLDRNLELVERLRPIAERHGVTVGAVAVAWTLTFPGVTAAIVGGRSPEQVDGWVGAATLTLTDQDLTEIRGALETLTIGEGPLAPAA